MVALECFFLKAPEGTEVVAAAVRGVGAYGIKKGLDPFSVMVVIAEAITCDEFSARCAANVNHLRATLLARDDVAQIDGSAGLAGLAMDFHDLVNSNHSPPPVADCEHECNADQGERKTGLEEVSDADFAGGEGHGIRRS